MVKGTTGDDRDTVDPIEKEIEKVTTSFGVEFDATLKQLLLSTKAVSSIDRFTTKQGCIPCYPHIR
jgi:hypothetical protein